MSALAVTTPNLRATSRGTMMLTSALAVPAKRLEDLDEVVPASWGWSISRVSPSIADLEVLAA